MWAGQSERAHLEKGLFICAGTFCTVSWDGGLGGVVGYERRGQERKEEKNSSMNQGILFHKAYPKKIRPK